MYDKIKQELRRVLKRDVRKRVILRRHLIHGEPLQITHQHAILLTCVTPHFVSWLGLKLRADFSIKTHKISFHHLMLAREQLDVRA